MTTGHPSPRHDHVPGSLADRLDRALTAGDPSGVGDLAPVDVADGLQALLVIHDLWMAPLPTADGRERFTSHPDVLALKARLEADQIARLDAWADAGDPLPVEAVAALRRVARADAVPAVYRWIAEEADLDEIVAFLALEGGPDADFDDLVALCQVGIRGVAKVALAANYWDELGRGDEQQVHTVLHDQLVEALAMPRIPRSEQPEAALERAALNGLLATNRHLQPEMIGALGLLELQAGPRCRQVVKGLRRTGAPAAALPFYQEHADVDPHHGKDWLDRAVGPLVAEIPAWASRIVHGARWRSAVNHRFFVHAADAFGAVTEPSVGRAGDGRRSLARPA